MSLSVCGENLGQVPLPKLRKIFDVVIDGEKDKKHYAKKRILQNEKFWIASDLVEARMFGTMSGKPIRSVSNAYLIPEVRLVDGAGMPIIVRNDEVAEGRILGIDGTREGPVGDMNSEMKTGDDRNQPKSSRYASKRKRICMTVNSWVGKVGKALSCYRGNTN